MGCKKHSENKCVKLTDLVLGHGPEDVLLLLDELGHQEAAAGQDGGDGAPAQLRLGVVLLLQRVVEDLAVPVVQRGVPAAQHRVLTDLLEAEVHRLTGNVWEEEGGATSQ